ncbi:MAG: hypothetical protein HOP11_14450 [Saprospiraceae bacterium]|nr:hypothetical protein [Saprospiraceae bacterium]
MFKYVFLFCLSSLISAQPLLIKDNLVGPKDGCANLNQVDDLILAYKSKIYFCGTNRFADFSTDGDFEPWVYDPATDLMTIHAQLIPFKGSVPNKFFISGDKMYFAARDEFNLYDYLYVSDGTKAGTINLSDSIINKLKGMLVNSSRNTIASLRNGAIFNAYETNSTFGLWYTDSTRKGTIRLNANGFADNFIVHPKYNVALFSQNGKFMISDGTVAGTKELNDLLNISSVNSSSVGAGIFGDNFLLEALDINTGTFGLFVTSGISNQYTKLVEFGGVASKVRNVTDLGNNRCIFSNDKGIYLTDGTKSGTSQIPGLTSYKLMNAYKDLWTIYKGKVYFAASDTNTGKGVELYVSDGTISGTKMLIDINATASSIPSNFNVYKDLLYFTATTTIHGNELWYTDGINSARLSDINPGAADSNPMYLTGLDNNLYFSAIQTNSGRELYRFSLAKVSIDNISSNTRIDVLPTINNGEFLIKSNDNQMISSISVKNENGIEICLIKEPQSIIDLKNHNVTPGLYFISFFAGNKLISTKKIIVY